MCYAIYAFCDHKIAGDSDAKLPLLFLFFFWVTPFKTSHTRFLFLFSLSKLFTMGDTIEKRTKFIEEDGTNKNVYILKATWTFNVTKNNNANLFITNNNK